MKYYRFECAVDTEETGHVYPQIRDESPVYGQERWDAMERLEYDRFPAFVPNLNYYELDKNAKLTDALTGGIAATRDGGVIKALVISEKLKNIFMSHITVPCRYYPATLKVKDTFYNNYFFMHVVSDLPDYIDYEKTLFFIKEYGDDLGSVKISSKTEYESFNKKLEGIKFLSSNKPCLKKEIIDKYDLFIETHFRFNIYISEKLKNALEEEKVTGISVIEANDIEVV